MGYSSSSCQTWRLGLTGFATISHCGFWLLPPRSPIIMPSVPAKSRSPQPLGLVWANWEKLGKMCSKHGVNQRGLSVVRSPIRGAQGASGPLSPEPNCGMA